MQSRIVLVSDDSNFFEYIIPKLNLRKNDELYRFKFSDLTDKLDIILSSLVIINGEDSVNQTLELLSLINGTPAIVFSYNDEEDFRIKCYQAGCLSWLTIMSDEKEIHARISVCLDYLSKLQKNKKYREVLVDNKLITPNNEVFLDYTKIIEKELDNLKQNASSAVLAAIAPNDKSKFFLRANQIETFILGSIRQNDILMNFAPNKYFLLLNDTNIDDAKKIWQKIKTQIPEKMYAGFAVTNGKNRGQLVSEALNKLHEEINKDSASNFKNPDGDIGNFKLFRKEFNKKIEQIVVPVLYHAQQKYGEKYLGVNISTDPKDKLISLKSRHKSATMKITTPGCTKINVDLEYIDDSAKNNNNDEKRITFNPDEFESGILEDLVEQFILEFKNEVIDDYS